MMAALSAGKAIPGEDIVIFEKNEFLGRKLLATGNGKCNLSNRDCSLNEYGGEERGFPKEILFEMDPEKTRAFFEELGLFVWEDDAGRRYPSTMQAKTVKMTLEAGIKDMKIHCLLGKTVAGLEKTSGGFRIEDGEKRIYNARSVIIATGGLAGGQYGSSGDGYAFAERLGHFIIPPKPALVQILIDCEGFSRLKGVRAKGSVALCEGKKTLYIQKGEIQFAEGGLSGICIFELSRYLRSEQRAYVRIDLFPGITKSDMLKRLARRRDFLRSRKAGEFLNGMVHERLTTFYMKKWGVDGSLAAGDLSFEDLKLLAGLLKALCLPVKGLKGFSDAQVTAGGVRTNEVDGSTLESRLVPGLYFAGEVLDVDGSCGGRNLQWAWSSGYRAGISASLKI